MRILLAIESTKPKVVGDAALRWAGALGYDVAVFAPRHKRKKYLEMIADVNYNWYLALEPNIIVTKETPQMYAALNGYDLIVMIPEEMESWRKGARFHKNEVNHAYAPIGNARGEFSRHPKKRIHRFHNGVVMERVG